VNVTKLAQWAPDITQLSLCVSYFLLLPLWMRTVSKHCICSS